MQQRLKWSWSCFIIGFLNKKFLVSATITYFFQEMIFNGFSDEIKIVIIIVWGIIAFTFMVSCAIEKFIEKGNLNMDLKLGSN